jgi:hypothetical protein
VLSAYIYQENNKLSQCLFRDYTIFNCNYGIPVLLVLGNVGNLFTVFTLGCTLKQGINSCTLYVLCASIANWIVVDTTLVLSFYGIDHIEPIHLSNGLCKLRWYGGYVLFMRLSNCSKLYFIN